MHAEALGEVPVPARVQGGAQLGERRTELGGLRHVHHVRGEQQAEPDAEARAVRRRERRGGECRHLLEQRLHEPVQVRLRVVALRRHAGNVASRAKGAALSAEEQSPHHPAGGGGSGVVVRPIQFRKRCLVKRVQLFRGIEDNFGDAVGDGELDHSYIP